MERLFEEPGLTNAAWSFFEQPPDLDIPILVVDTTDYVEDVRPIIDFIGQRWPGRSGRSGTAS